MEISADVNVRCNQLEFLEALKRVYKYEFSAAALGEGQPEKLEEIMRNNKLGFDEHWKLRFDFSDPDYFVWINIDRCLRDPICRKLCSFLDGIIVNRKTIDLISKDRILVYLALYRLLDCPDSRDNYEEPFVFFDDHPDVCLDGQDIVFTVSREVTTDEESSFISNSLECMCKTTIEIHQN